MMNSNELLEKIMRLQWLLQRQHQQRHSARGPFTDPTRGQGRVLALLKIQPEISTGDLSYLLGIRQQSLSELLGKLEKAGYITRTPLENDRRVMMVKLTEKGKAAQQEPPEFSGLFDCLTPEEQETLNSYLDRIISKAEAELGVDNREDMEQWMEQARSRMGEDAFEHLMAARGRNFRDRGNSRDGSRRNDQNLHGRFRSRPDDFYQ